MSKIIVIFGVTGIQGSSVANTFLNLPGWKVRGITRNPSSPAAQAHAANGVELFQANIDDDESLLPAFTGANVIFSNTDFFGLFFQALTSLRDGGGGGGGGSSSSPRIYAYEREVEQGLNIARIAALPAVLDTLDRFVLSSLSDARKWSNGKYSRVYHNNSKTVIIETINTKFPQLAQRMSLLQVGHYVTNWKQSAPLAPQKQPHESFVVKRTFSPETPMPFVVTHKDTGSFVKALVLDVPAGTHLLGASQIMTWPEWTKIWADTLGVQALFEQVSHDEFFVGVPAELKEELKETFSYTEEFGYTGGDPDVVTVEQLGIEIPLTSMEEYIKSEDWSSVL